MRLGTQLTMAHLNVCCLATLLSTALNELSSTPPFSGPDQQPCTVATG